MRVHVLFAKGGTSYGRAAGRNKTMVRIGSGCVEARLNMVISGSSGSGETGHTVRLETARPPDIEGAGAITERGPAIDTMQAGGSGTTALRHRGETGWKIRFPRSQVFNALKTLDWGPHCIAFTPLRARPCEGANLNRLYPGSNPRWPAWGNAGSIRFSRRSQAPRCRDRPLRWQPASHRARATEGVATAPRLSLLLDVRQRC